MKVPNLFDHARSELAQDAVLAYILEWARPELRQIDPQMHELGNHLLREMLERCNVGKMDVRSLEVRTQENRVDVQVILNDKVVLFIEDKTKGALHSNQIERYRETLKAKGKTVYALYVKTGNESCTKRPGSADGCMYRQDLLRVLGEHPVRNTIMENFREHLQVIEEETESFYHRSVFEEWPWRAVEGYYMALEKHFGLCGKQRSDREGSDPDEGWDYTPNPKGGFLGFWWHYQKIRVNDTICFLYLQIENARKLTARLGYCKSVKGEEQKITAKQLWTVFDWLQEHAKTFQGLRVEKVGRFHGGLTSAVAVLGFPSRVFPGELTYLVADADGRLDMKETLRNLCTAMELINIVSRSHSP